jgi:integrase
VASIHRHPKSPFWVCYYTLPDGRRTSRSTGQRDKKRARLFCIRLEEASDKARAGELTETTARRILDSILESSGARALPISTTRAFAHSWLAGKEPSISRSTASRYRQVVTAFCESLGPTADRSLQSVTGVHIATYRDERLRKDHISRGTIGRDLAALSSMFISARRQGLILINPVEGIQLPVSKSQSLEREVFTVQELQALLALASPEWRILILCGFYLGGRLADMARLSWDAVDFTAGVITYTQAKTGKRVVVPLHPELEEALLAIAGEKGGPICPALSKTRTDGHTGLSNKFSRLMKEAGIDRQAVCIGKNTTSRKSYHCLRHSFTSFLANAAVSPEIRMKLTGHLSEGVHQRYTHHELQPLKDAIATLPKLRPSC